MRIGILTAHLPPVLGGIELHCQNLGTALAMAGHDVVLYGSLERGQPRSMELENPPGTDGLTVRRIPAVFAPGLRRATRYRNLRRRVMKDHREAPFDVLHAHQLWPIGCAGVRLAKLCGTEICITEHGAILDHVKNPAKRWLIGGASRWARAVITASRELAEVAANGGVRRDILLALPNAIWPQQFELKDSREEVRQRLNLPGDAFIACMVRRLVPKTGVQYALRATDACRRLIPNYRLVVVGDGPMRGELEALTRELGVGDAVTFVGSVDNSRVPEYMRAANIGLFPSLAEATSIACLEFMATGTPVVASTVGGLPEIVQDGRTGFLFDMGFSRSRYTDPGLGPDVVERIARTIAEAAGSNLTSFGKAAREFVRTECSWPAYVRTLEERAYPDRGSNRSPHRERT